MDLHFTINPENTNLTVLPLTVEILSEFCLNVTLNCVSLWGKVWRIPLLEKPSVIDVVSKTKIHSLKSLANMRFGSPN